jgi:Tfp pilus assembly protein PilE
MSLIGTARVVIGELSMKQSKQSVVLVIAVAAIMVTGWQGSAFAANAIDQRVARMEQRMQRMEQQLQKQNREIQAKDSRIYELEQRQEQNSQSSGGGWFQNVTVSGAVEIEAFGTDSDGFSGDDAGDINVTTAELGLEAVINNWAIANLVLLWEEEDGGSSDLIVDEAIITFANPDETPFYFTAGRTAAPFGRFETNMVSDPLTLDIGETKETLVLVGVETEGFYAGIYGFNGDLDDGGDNVIDNGGVDLGFAWESEDRGVDFGVSYINDIGDSDGVSDVISGNQPVGVDYGRNIPGYAAHAMFTIGSFNLIGEYVAASKDFDATNELAFNGSGAKPSAWNLEAGYAFNIAGHEGTFAVGYQKTKQALGLGLPEKRLSAAFSVVMLENTTLSLEWAHDEDYGSGDVDAVSGTAGTGDDADTITAQLAIEF